MSTSIQAEIDAAHQHLETQGWFTRHSEAFRHLPPPALDRWLGKSRDTSSPGASTTESGWSVRPIGETKTSGFEARSLDALDPVQRKALFEGVPPPGDDEAAPFVWAHRALCRRGLRLRVKSPSGTTPAEQARVALQLRYRPRSSVEAPLLVINVEDGAHCTLIETHESGAKSEQGLVQNMHMHINLGRGATLLHLRIATPRSRDEIAHHMDVRLQENARYAQALVASGSTYHLQRCNMQLLGEGAETRNTGLLLTGEHAIDQQIYTRLEAPRTHSKDEMLVLAGAEAKAVCNSYGRIAPGAHDADVVQMLRGVALDGHPRLVLRPHMEILHDQVEALHGATWGALPEDALFYASQRGLDKATARRLIIEGMAHAVLERCFDHTEEADQSGPIAEWLAGNWLNDAIARYVHPDKELAHG